MTNTTAFSLDDVLRAAAEGLRWPVIVILILLMAAAVALLGWLFAELLGERRRLRVQLPELLDALNASRDPAGTIQSSGLLKTQKAALLELTRHPDLSPDTREALAVRLLEQEQARYDRIVRYSELVARLGPMFGLLGTLIPLGAGIIALGQGDTYTLSASMLTAFDTTIAGLAAAAVATVISSVRRAWYKNDMSMLELLAQSVLEQVKGAAA